MGVAVAPATMLELAELGGARTRQQWGDVRALAAAGRLYAFRVVEGRSGPGQPPGELLAVGGFIPIPGTDGWGQMVFNAAPACARHVPGFLGAARLTIEAAPYRGLLTLCGTRAGKVFARRLGFAFRANSPLGEVWGYGPAFREQQGAAAGPAAAGQTDRGEPAHQPGADRG